MGKLGYIKERKKMNARYQRKIGELIAEKYLEQKGFSVIAKNEWGVNVVAKCKNWRDGLVLVFVQIGKRAVNTDISRWLLETGYSGAYRTDKLIITKQKKSYRVDYYEYINFMESGTNEYR